MAKRRHIFIRVLVFATLSVLIPLLPIIAFAASDMPAPRSTVAPNTSDVSAQIAIPHGRSNVASNASGVLPPVPRATIKSSPPTATAIRATATRIPPTATVATSGIRALPDPLYGVTIDDISSLTAIRTALASMAHMPTTRIVFDRQEGTSYYAPAITTLQPVSYLMGTILDSSDMTAVTGPQYTQRTTDFLNAFGNQVDLWEIGNEINGEWLGATNDVVSKMTSAYDIIHGAGKHTALTLYYNGLDDTINCYANSSNLMFRWAQSNIPDQMKQGLDYVLISFYDQDCPGVSHDWTTIFTQLHQMFPNSKIGFGENGTTTASDSLSLKEQYMDTYYQLSVPVPGYIGGHFWWYFREDCVPNNTALWSYLNGDFAIMPTH